MLGTSTTEDRKDVVLGVEATGLGEASDGARHRFISNPDETKGCFKGCHCLRNSYGFVVRVDFLGHGLEGGKGGDAVEGLVFGGSEDLREILGEESA